MHSKTMKKLASVVLLLLAFPLLVGGGFEISGKMGSPSLPWGILLSLGAQIALLAAASVSPSRSERLGFFRTVALTII